jgi:hypothetical protein
VIFFGCKCTLSEWNVAEILVFKKKIRRKLIYIKINISIACERK